MIFGLSLVALTEVLTLFGANAVKPYSPQELVSLFTLFVAALALFVQPAVQVSADRPLAQYEIGRLLWWEGPQVSGKKSARSPQMQTEEWERWLAELLPLLVRADLMLFDDAVALRRAVRAHKVCREALRIGLRILNARYFDGIPPENYANGSDCAGSGRKRCPWLAGRRESVRDHSCVLKPGKSERMPPFSSVT